VRLPREGLWFDNGGVVVVEFIGAHSDRYAWIRYPHESSDFAWIAAKEDLLPLTPAARELMKLDWSAL
jgi:hypothetical protein